MKISPKAIFFRFCKFTFIFMKIRDNNCIKKKKKIFKP